jgi:Zn finger protein HypA/HybF involved in hydrogenase expression
VSAHFFTILLAGVCLLASLSRLQAQTTTPGGYFIPSFGQPLKSSFDHARTKFPLTGAHAQTSCEACHFNGQYKNTLYACPACHNGNRTIGKPPNHPPTSLKCAGCHETTLFTDIKVIDHTQASPNCVACHNGKIAGGKTATHIPTNAPCAECHRTTWSFRVGVDLNPGLISKAPAPSVFRRRGVTGDAFP